MMKTLILTLCLMFQIKWSKILLRKNEWQPDFKVICQRVEEQVNFTKNVIFVLEK